MAIDYISILLSSSLGLIVNQVIVIVNHVTVIVNQLILVVITMYLEEFEDTTGIIRMLKSKNYRQHKRKRTKGQTAIYKTLHIKSKIEKHYSHGKLGVNSGANLVRITRFWTNVHQL